MTAEQELRLWPPAEVVSLDTNQPTQLTPYGVFVLGDNLTRFEWALTATTERLQVLMFLAPLRRYAEVERFEVIGQEASSRHDMLSTLTGANLSIGMMDELRTLTTRWNTIAAERLSQLFLITPHTALNTALLAGGVNGLLSRLLLDVLDPLEKSDLNSACACVLVGSATPAEYIALRAAESLLRRWYEVKTHKKIQRGAWGSVLDELEAEYPQRDRPKEITLLGYLKLRRDEVAHPDRISSTGDAETTLMNVCHLIQGIHQLLPGSASFLGQVYHAQIGSQ